MNPYFEQMILSASPIELVRLMYQQAIASVADAREHLREGRIRERVAAIRKAYGLITELLVSLDASKAPEIAGNLRRIYSYMLARLNEANFSKSDAPLEEVGRLLSTLADAWQDQELVGASVAAEAEVEPVAVLA